MSAAPTKTKRNTKAAMGPFGQVGKIVDELDDRLGVAKGGRVFLDKIFPDHWSFMLGEISLYSFVVLLATGVFLSLYYVPSTQQVLYHGSYKPLDGQWVSEAFRSTVQISFNVRGGLLIRQMHHWAADIFTGSIVVHMARIFFTGAFRKPRELNYTIGLTMLILAIFESAARRIEAGAFHEYAGRCARFPLEVAHEVARTHMHALSKSLDRQIAG